MKDNILLMISYIMGIILGIAECISVVGAILGIPTLILSYQTRKYYNMKKEEINKNKDTFLIISIVLAIVSPICGLLNLIYYILLERENEKKIHANK